jgi:neurotransmitter:Na+ symporter, NSS family
VLLVFTALTSSMAFMEVLVANLIDRYDWSRRRSVIISASLVFIFGIPSALSGTDWFFPEWEEMFGMTFFETLSHVVATWLLPLAGLSVAVFTGWKLPKEKCLAEFKEGSKYACFFSIWFFSIRYIVPIAILLIILDRSGILHFDAIFGYSVEPSP